MPRGVTGMGGAPPSTPKGRALGNQLATGTRGCLRVNGSRRAPASPVPQGPLHFPVPLGARCAPGAPVGSAASCQERPQAPAASLAPAWPRGPRWAGSEGWPQPCSARGSPCSPSPRGEGLGKQGGGRDCAEPSVLGFKNLSAASTAQTVSGRAEVKRAGEPRQRGGPGRPSRACALRLNPLHPSE